MNAQDLTKLTKVIAKEFPGDPALQQIHLDRKVLSQEAREKHLSFVDYINTFATASVKS